MGHKLIEGDNFCCTCAMLRFCCGVGKNFAHSVNELCIHETACTIPTDTNLPLGHYQYVMRIMFMLDVLKLARPPEKGPIACP